MGCCSSKNGISPRETPKKRPPSYGFQVSHPNSVWQGNQDELIRHQDKQILVSGKISDANNNSKTVRPRPVLRGETRAPVQPPPSPAAPPPPPPELDVATLVLLEGHDGYVDVAGWSPTEDVLVTGSSDR